MTMPIFPLPLGETGMLEELEHRNVLPLPPTGVRLSPGVQAFVMKRFWECSLMMTYLFPSTYQRHKGLPNSLKWESVGFLKPIIVYSPLWLSSPGIFHSHVSSYSAPSNSQHCHHSILIWRGCSCVLLGKTVSPDFRVAVCPAASALSWVQGRSLFQFVQLFFTVRMEVITLHIGAEIHCPQFLPLTCHCFELSHWHALSHSICHIPPGNENEDTSSCQLIEMDMNLAPAFCFSNEKIDHQWGEERWVKIHSEIHLYWLLRPA